MAQTLTPAEKIIRQAYAETKGAELPEDISNDQKLAQLGMDSLDVVELLTSIENQPGGPTVEVEELGASPTWGTFCTVVAGKLG